MNRMRGINEAFGEFMVQIGSLFIPVAPAILLGFGMFASFPAEMGAGLKLAAAIAAPIGTTAVEFTVGKMFVKAWVEGRQREMRVAAAVGVIAISVITIGVLTLEAGTFQKILNIGLYIVALCSYLAQALNQLGRERETAEVRQENTQIEILKLEVEKAKAEASGKRAEARAANVHERPRTTTNDTPDLRYVPEVRAFHGLMNGDPFTRLTVEEKLGVAKTKASEIIKTGLSMGVFAAAGRNIYKAVHD